MAAAGKNILVTGGNAGIGLALCRQLAVDHGAKVYMGSRSLERGAEGLKTIAEAHPEAARNVEVLSLDVSSDDSVAAAAAALKEKGVTLYALVNNAGVGLKTNPDGFQALLNTNVNGPKRVFDAFHELLDPREGRVVNVSSGMASSWLSKEGTAEQQALFTSPDATWEQLDAAVQEAAPIAGMGGYGLSKAALTAYTIQQAKLHPNLVCTSLSPGFIETKMTSGFGAKLGPEQGTVSLVKCLFGDVVSGYYYGSDGLRSPLTVGRDPGMPEYEGEENPDHAKYNR